MNTTKKVLITVFCFVLVLLAIACMCCGTELTPPPDIPPVPTPTDLPPVPTATSETATARLGG